MGAGQALLLRLLSCSAAVCPSPALCRCCAAVACSVCVWVWVCACVATAYNVRLARPRYFGCLSPPLSQTSGLPLVADCLPFCVNICPDRPERRWQARGADRHSGRPAAPAGASQIWRRLCAGRGERCAVAAAGEVLGWVQWDGPWTCAAARQVCRGGSTCCSQAPARHLPPRHC